MPPSRRPAPSVLPVAAVAAALTATAACAQQREGPAHPAKASTQAADPSVLTQSEYPVDRTERAPAPPGWPIPAEPAEHDHSTCAGAVCFGEPTFYPLETGVIRAADMTGDGFPDIVGHRFSQFEVFVLPNAGDGTGAFLPPLPPLNIGVPISDLDVDDVDGDGDADIVTVSQLANAMTVVLNDGDGGLSFDQHLLFARPSRVRLEHIDQDPEAEVFVNDGFGLTRLDRTPAGGFIASTPFPPGDVVFGDLDLDGDPDAALSMARFTAPAPETRLYLNDGDGAFTLWQTLDTFTSNFGIQAIVADFTGDGLPDIVHQQGSTVVGVSRQLPDGSFLGPHRVEFSDTIKGVGAPLIAIDVLDINHDGYRDLVINEARISNVDPRRINRIRILPGAPGGAINGWMEVVHHDLVQTRAIDAEDLRILLRRWGTDDPQADNSGDGVVDGRDITGVLNAFGPFDPLAGPLAYQTLKSLDFMVLTDFDRDGRGDIGFVVTSHENGVESFATLHNETPRPGGVEK